MFQKNKVRRTRANSTSRRAADSGLGRLTRDLPERWQRLLGWDPFWVIVFLVPCTWALLPADQFYTPRVEAGSIASRDFVAPRDLLLPDEETTREKRERAREEVLEVYDFDLAAASRVEEEAAGLFAAGRQLVEDEADEQAQGRGGSVPPDAGEEAADPLGGLLEASGLKIERPQLELLHSRGFSSDLEDRLRGLLAATLRRGVVAGKAVLLENRSRGIQLRNLLTGQERRQLDLYDYLGYPEEVREFLPSEVRDWSGFRSRERALLVNLLFANTAPNLHLNQSETLHRKEAAAAAVEQVYTRVRKGQVIVRKGDQVTSEAAWVISHLGGHRRALVWILPLLGTFLLLSLVVLAVWLALRSGRMARLRGRSVLGEVLLLLLVSAMGAKLSYQVAQALAGSFEMAPFNSARSYALAAPYASLALICVLLYGRHLAVLISVLFSLIVGQVVGGEAWWLVVYSVAGSWAAIFIVDEYQFKDRSAMTRAGLMVGGVNVAWVLALAAMTVQRDGGGVQVVMDVVGAFAGGLLVSAVASFLVPVLESVFCVATGIKLVELANTNLPLLRRLAFEAPGTFQHSLMVANLAKAGCQAVEADSVLAYTAALYHDIGKIFRPEYFIENQRPGHNRHDKLQPSMSALILISHIKDGLELAGEYRLPQPVIDAIEQHHGTRLIKYFYHRAQEMQDRDSGEVSEAKYRYPGPRPRDKVQGVLMLADAVEAASRSLADPSPAKLRSVIRTIADDCLKDGQLDDTDLTLGDLSRVSEAFQRVLTHIYHRRIDYPGFDFNVDQREKKRRESRETREAPEPPLPQVM